MKITAYALAAVLIAAAPAAATTKPIIPDPALTYNAEDVVMAIDTRLGELEAEIMDLTMNGGSAFRIRLLTIRTFQLRSFNRLVSRFQTVQLGRVVEYYGLDVSPN